MRNQSDPIFSRPSPANRDAERYVLSSMLNSGTIPPALCADDFNTEDNRWIFAAMERLDGAGVQVNRLSLIEELQRHKHLESTGGLSYVVSLDEGMPKSSI